MMMLSGDIFIEPTLRSAQTDFVVIYLPTFQPFTLKFSVKVFGQEEWLGHDSESVNINALPNLYFYFGKVTFYWSDRGGRVQADKLQRLTAVVALIVVATKIIERDNKDFFFEDCFNDSNNEDDYFQIFDQPPEVLATNQAVPAKVKYIPKIGRQI